MVDGERVFSGLTLFILRSWEGDAYQNMRHHSSLIEIGQNYINISKLKPQTACKFKSPTRLVIGTVVRLNSGMKNYCFVLWIGYWFLPVVKRHLRELGQQMSVKPNQMWIGFLPQTLCPYNLIYFSRDCESIAIQTHDFFPTANYALLK